MVKSHAESQRNPVELWLSTLNLGGLAHSGFVVMGVSKGSAMGISFGRSVTGQVGTDGRWLVVRRVTGWMFGMRAVWMAGDLRIPFLLLMTGGGREYFNGTKADEVSFVRVCSFERKVSRLVLYVTEMRVAFAGGGDCEHAGVHGCVRHALWPI